MTEPQTATRKVWMAPELMAEWATRDLEGNRLSWDWGEPDEDGFYTPAVTRHYDDNLRAEARRDLEQRLAALEGALGRSAEGLHDYALLDPDIGIEHSSTPWTTCPADECAAVLALLAPATATPGEET